MLVRLNAGENQQRNQVVHHDDKDDGDNEIKNQQLGFFSGFVLSLEKVHVF